MIGLAIAAPVGPIGVLCIRRTLGFGLAHGVMSGLGAATADAFYGFVAAFGLTALSSLLIDNMLLLSIAGSLFLLFLGMRTLLAVPATEHAEVAHSSGRIVLAYTSTLILTLTNPLTILSFLSIFVGMGSVVDRSASSSSIVVVIGVFTGSLLWWLVLCGGISLVRRRIDIRWMRWINRGSGVVIILFALRILLTLSE